ncbi:MAG: JAB domain-containing protein [Chakrabartia godavariana]
MGTVFPAFSGVMDLAFPLQRDVEPAYAALFAPYLAMAAQERLAIAYFDTAGTLLDLEVSTAGRHDAVGFPVRQIVRTALGLEAAALMLAHNHPSGDPAPSAADRHMTRRLAAALRPLDIRLIDHLIFGGAVVMGFRARGLV